jgi:ketosteroid isomerase-like protein
MHPAGGAPVHRRGPGLSVWRNQPNGQWVIFRDANMVTTQEQTGENAKTAE